MYLTSLWFKFSINFFNQWWKLWTMLLLVLAAGCKNTPTACGTSWLFSTPSDMEITTNFFKASGMSMSNFRKNPIFPLEKLNNFSNPDLTLWPCLTALTVQWQNHGCWKSKRTVNTARYKVRDNLASRPISNTNHSSKNIPQSPSHLSHKQDVTSSYYVFY